jgi:hypothetical protein
MKKSTLLIAALVLLFVGGAIHAIFFQPDPYTSVAPVEEGRTAPPSP